MAVKLSGLKKMMPHYRRAMRDECFQAVLDDLQVRGSCMRCPGSASIERAVSNRKQHLSVRLRWEMLRVHAAGVVGSYIQLIVQPWTPVAVAL
jgi:hypothetical protein